MCSPYVCLFLYLFKDELTSANCVAFNLDGSKIYTGYNKTIRIFESARPGRDFTERSTVGKTLIKSLYTLYGMSLVNV